MALLRGRIKNVWSAYLEFDVFVISAGVFCKSVPVDGFPNVYSDIFYS